MNGQIHHILQKRMDRKDFLKHVAIGIVALTGVTALIKAFKPQQQPVTGYGASTYGGQRSSKV